MDTSQTQRLIKKMLAKPDLMPETREELQDHLDELEKGSLHPDDARYIEGLARRLGFAEGGGAPVAGDDGDAGDDDGDDGVFHGDERTSDTAAAVQAEIALRKIAQARDLIGQLRTPPAEGAAPDLAASDATLAEIDGALAEAAEALTRNG
jgi:hypothetical protein